MKKIGIALLLYIGIISCGRDKDEVYTPVVDKSEYLTGGKATVMGLGFSVPAPNLSVTNQQKHDDGDFDFEQSFVTAPAPAFGGLGPVFNHISCEGCHPNDGRSPFPTDLKISNGLLIRISIPGVDKNGGPKPVPGFGTQLQHRVSEGKIPEAEVNVTFEEKEVTFADGSSVTLRKPIFKLVNPYISLPTNVMISPRLAPPIFAMGLLEAIPESRLLQLEDINDADGDGISGKLNYVWDVTDKKLKPGRFGWKGDAPTSLQQVAGAYHQDMGITNPVFMSESSYKQLQYDGLNDEPEISSTTLNNVTVYVQTLGPPIARNLEKDQILRGRVLFNEAKCNACHVAKHQTAVSFAELIEFSNLTIYPYTDLLLHDMGEELADNRPVFKASGREWQTRPLWGIGLTQFNNGHTDLLHDGRARNVEEAILWHGGEAQKSQEYYRKLNKADRESLLSFVNSI